MKTVPNSIAPKPRVSQKIRDAIRYRVREGLSIKAAAEKADMSRNGFAKALRRSHVAELLEREQEAYVLESAAVRATYRARALDLAMDLAKNAKSETVRARMIEFLASEPKAPQVAVKIDNAPKILPGYTYVPPGKKKIPVSSQEDEMFGRTVVEIVDNE